MTAEAKPQASSPQQVASPQHATAPQQVAAPQKATEPKQATTLRALGQWARIVAIALSSLALAFASGLLITSQAVVGSAHQRNWQDLEVLTSALESWPRDLAMIAAGSQDNGKSQVQHPDLGLITFEFKPCAELAASSTSPFLPGKIAGEGARLQVVGTLPPRDGEPVAQSDRCFRTAIELNRLLALDRQAPGFAALLIVTADASVVEQVGKPKLPVTTLGPLVPVVVFARNAAGALEDSGKSPEKPVELSAATSLGANPGVVKVTIADIDYLAYVRPFTLRGQPHACPGRKPESAPDEATKNAESLRGAAPVKPAAGAEAIDRPCVLYAVGLMPSTRLRHAWQSPPTLLLCGFGLTLLVIVAMLPLVRLLLIGGAEYASRPQVIAMIFGLHVAVAVATLGALFVFEVASERQGARDEASRSATDLANRAGSEIGKFIDDGLNCTTRDKASTLEFYDTRIFDSDGKVQEGRTSPCESAVPMPASTNISARQYFQDLKLAPLGMGESSYALGAVRAQVDGLDKVALAVPQPISKRPASNSDVMVVSTILSSLLRPVLPVPQRFMVVDAGLASLPVLFHSNKARAGVEVLTRQANLSDDAVAAITALASTSMPRQSSFTAEYEGHRTVFTASPIRGTRWVLLVFYALDDIDATAGWTTARALSSWASLFGPVMLIGYLLMLARKGWLRRLWPFEAAQDIYRDGAGTLTALGLCILFLAAMPPLGILGLIALVPLIVVKGRFAAILREPTTPAALTVESERRYRRFVLAALFCISAAPMVVVWADARVDAEC